METFFFFLYSSNFLSQNDKTDSIRMRWNDMNERHVSSFQYILFSFLFYSDESERNCASVIVCARNKLTNNKNEYKEREEKEKKNNTKTKNK